MSTAFIAIPSEHPGGLDAAIGAHFGHCDLYTLLEAADGRIVTVSTLPNIPHQQGGCMAPVNHLKQAGVTTLIAGGMGMRPLMGFDQVGIRVYHAGNTENVGEAALAWLRGELAPFSLEFTCGGGQQPVGAL
jgi:predicted Fe-Mo cluster-binding NifX family protein